MHRSPAIEVEKQNEYTKNYGEPKKIMTKKPSVTIYIHGTLPPTTMLRVPFISRFFRCPQGLTSLSHLSDSHIVDALTHLCTHHADEYPLEHCYVFGWPGSLAPAARKDAAFDLYKCLADLKKDYAQRGLFPSITLLTHSHGGNVALWLKKIADTYDNPADLTIETLIMLACPVQLDTAEYAQGSLFMNVYSLHSHHDILQVIDPQGLHAFLDALKNCGLEFTLAHLKQLGPFFSERHFPHGSKVRQLKVKYSHRDLFHIEFLLPPFMVELPILIEKMKQLSPDSLENDLVHVINALEKT